MSKEQSETVWVTTGQNNSLFNVYHTDKTCHRINEDNVVPKDKELVDPDASLCSYCDPETNNRADDYSKYGKGPQDFIEEAGLSEGLEVDD